MSEQNAQPCGTSSAVGHGEMILKCYEVTMPAGEVINGFSQTIELVGRIVDATGVGVIVIGILVATIRFLLQTQQKQSAGSTFKSYRQGLGRALLLGLEVLVAADIIRTVAIQPTFQSVGILAGIVVIRTFLSWSLEVELEGSWPWQHHGTGESGTLGHDQTTTQ